MFNKLIFILCVLFPINCFAVCQFGCLFQPGTSCINNECVPNIGPVIPPTPTPNPSKITNITIQARPFSEVINQSIKCSEVDLKNFRIYLKTNPPGQVSFYSAIYSKDITYYARKDILGKYVFIETVVKPQFTGEDFVFDTWENLAYKEVFNTLSCQDLTKYLFVFGISKKADLSDFKGGTFSFAQ